MVRALKERVLVGPAGRVVIDRSELPEGSSAEVIVLIDEGSESTRASAEPLSKFIGVLKGQFSDASEADHHLRQLRDEWERP